MNIGNILKKSLRESQFCSTGKCAPVEVYVFGSSAICKKFNDVDLLFIVSDDAFDRVRLYDALHDLCRAISHRLNCVIDFTILTQTEDRALGFKDRAKAVFVDFVNISLCHEQVFCNLSSRPTSVAGDAALPPAGGGETRTNRSALEGSTPHPPRA